ncbi:unnamed protein product [Lymnaea stagnalis]|uniref:Uncharacterized protein n=1 Tax=Lymnaea stagnalis TaxID=6523 RepID=A0AAV2HCT7_LYMST
MNLFFFLTSLSSIWVSSNGQKIQLFPYRQEDSETNCTHGLVSDVDTVVFKAEIDFSEDINFQNLYFQRKCKNDVELVLSKSIVINGSVEDQGSWTMIRPNVANVTIRDKAKTECSGGRVRGVIVASDHEEIISDEQIFPEIREANDLDSKLFINGAETTLQNNSCNVNAKGTETVIVFQCGSQVLPCLIEISATDLATPIPGTRFVIHTSKLLELNITLKYASCTLQGNVNTFSCSIKREPEITTGILSTLMTIYILLLFLLMSCTLNCAVLVYILRRKKKSKLSKIICLRKETPKRTKMVLPKKSMNIIMIKLRKVPPSVNV